jgi:hypothetical protein
MIRAALFLAVLALAACGDMKPRPTQDSVVAAPPPTEKKDVDHMNLDLHHSSGSTLGKARDSAVRGVRNAEKHSEEVAKQADEVFEKKKPAAPAKPAPPDSP